MLPNITDSNFEIEFSASEIYDVLSKLNSRKAAGPDPVSEIEEYGKTIPVGQIVFRPFFTQMTQCVHLALLRFFGPKFMSGGRR